MRGTEAAHVPKGMKTMLRTCLLSALAAATLAGCATGYTYRSGNGGDYYYGQPGTEYRYQSPYGFYGSYGYGGFGYGFGGYYYDRFGRLVYANPYGYYPYGNGWYRPRPPHGHGGHDHDHGGNAGTEGERDDRRPPWRGFGDAAPRQPRMAGEDGEDLRRPRRQTAPLTRPAPVQPMQRPAMPSRPRMSDGDSGGSRMGRVIRNAKNPAASE